MIEYIIIAHIGGVGIGYFIGRSLERLSWDRNMDKTKLNNLIDNGLRKWDKNLVIGSDEEWIGYMIY